MNPFNSTSTIQNAVSIGSHPHFLCAARVKKEQIDFKYLIDINKQFYSIKNSFPYLSRGALMAVMVLVSEVEARGQSGGTGSAMRR